MSEIDAETGVDGTDRTNATEVHPDETVVLYVRVSTDG